MSISRLFVCFIALLLAFGGAAAQEPTLPAATPTPSPTATPIPAPTPPPDPLAAYANLYRTGNGAFASVAKFAEGNGPLELLLTDFRTGQVRVLTATQLPDNFTGGRSIFMPGPVTLRANFERTAEPKRKFIHFEGLFGPIQRWFFILKPRRRIIYLFFDSSFEFSFAAAASFTAFRTSPTVSNLGIGAFAL